MPHNVILASAGAGKSRHVAEQALDIAARGKNVLILTYTINNQSELLTHICLVNKHKPSNIVIKGWFTFLLEDMVRPYQRCIAPDRVAGITFDVSDPHFINGRATHGEKKEGGYNLCYFLTKQLNAHTTYLSKLAVRIHEKTQGKATQRLARIYDAIFVDEVQDLVGWDFDVIEAIADTKIQTFDCVGDFRQTIYRTSVARKKPSTNAEKLARFKKLGFVTEHMNVSRRCIQRICSFADLVHSGENIYSPTKSLVEEVPDQFSAHQGVFAVHRDDVSEYIARYNPMILRRNKVTEQCLCESRLAFNFGEAKGLGFDRVLVLPTDKYKKYLSGRRTIFDDDKTDEAKNKLYVAITRARYSVTFVLDRSSTLLNGMEVWHP